MLVCLSVFYIACVYVCLCLSESMFVCGGDCKQVNNNNHKSIPVLIPEDRF